jgi:hypothetical protein
MTSPLFDAFAPDADVLVRLIATHIDDDMLTEIADADYGKEQERHLAELSNLRAGKVLAAPMPWHPAEVLELFRWSEPSDPKHKPGRFGIEGHWMRAFACAALLRESHRAENGYLRSSWDNTAVQLVESLRILNQFHGPAVSLLSSLMVRFESDPGERIALFGYAMLASAIIPQAGVGDETLLALLEWSDARGWNEWKEGGGDMSEDWLVVSINQCICKETWKRVADRLLTDIERRSEKLQEPILTVASRLVGS